MLLSFGATTIRGSVIGSFFNAANSFERRRAHRSDAMVDRELQYAIPVLYMGRSCGGLAIESILPGSVSPFSK